MARIVESPDDRAAVAAAMTLATMDRINQADDHLADKNERLDAGKATESVALIPSVTLRGMPDVAD